MLPFVAQLPLLRIAFLLVIFAFLTACGDESSTPESSSASQAQLLLSWLPHPDKTIMGYLVYYGPTESTVTTVASDIPVTANNFDPQAPSVQYNAGLDLGLNKGDNVCFRLTAYNAAGQSGMSGSACSTI